MRDLCLWSAALGRLAPDDTCRGFENVTEEAHPKLKARARFEHGVGHDTSADFGKVAHDPVGDRNIVFEKGYGHGCAGNSAAKAPRHVIAFTLQ